MRSAIIAANSVEQPRGFSGRSRYLTPIANLPLIWHVLDDLADNGVEHARIVAGPSVRSELEAVLKGGRAWEMKISYSDLGAADGRHLVLAETEKALSDGPVVVHPGDCLFPGQLASMQERFGAGDVDLVLLADAADAPSADWPQGLAGPASSALFLLAPDTRPVLRRLLSPSGHGSDIIAALLASDCRVDIRTPDEFWRYSDSTQALLAANRMVLDALRVPATRVGSGEGNQLHGRVAISPGARITNSSLHGPIVVDDRAVVEDSFLGPYTAIGAGASIRGTEIDNTMVLSGAQVQYPGSRIEGSIIGERACLTRSFELPRGMHLRLPPDSRVTLS